MGTGIPILFIELPIAHYLSYGILQLAPDIGRDLQNPNVNCKTQYHSNFFFVEDLVYLFCTYMTVCSAPFMTINLVFKKY